MYKAARHLAIGLGIVGLLETAPARAQRSPAAAPIADVIAGAARLDFVPYQSGDGFVLTVSGPDGFIEQRQFEAGRPVMFNLNGPDGSTRRDGSYVYELRTRHAPAAAARSTSTTHGNETADGRQAEVESFARARTSNSESVFSGAFRILNGSILAGGMVEPRTSRVGASSSPAKTGSGRVPNGRTPLDVVTADDEIIQGSLCVGLDCVVNESFGFHTIRLKENNTRIGFVDTSTSAGFPANNWQLTANDSASGGANKFSIEDITGAKVPFTVTAGAADNSIFVDSTGRVGFRTATPVLDLHTNTSNTPALRLEQNNSGGFVAQTWDIGGNEANFFVRDVTNGSRLPFRIRPGAPTSSIDIASNGNVGIGTPSPQGALDLNTPAGVQMNYYFGQGGNRRWRWVVNDADPNLYMWDQTAAAYRFTFASGSGYIGIGTTNPTAPLHMASGAICTVGGVWTNASSREYKLNIRDLDFRVAEDTLAQLNPVTYTYKAAPGEHHVGFIAEDVPEIVATPDRKGLSSMDIVGVLTKVVQEQQKTICDLSERLERLEAASR